MKRICYISIGFISLLIGMIGTIIPMLPTVPFLLFAGICFARGSQRVYSWFKNTKLYQNHLKDYVNNKTMTLKCKIHIMLSMTILMLIGIFMMGQKDIVFGSVILFIIWLIHIIYFMFIVKTKKTVM